MPKTALALSGGGSHGAFQMGAIRYLYGPVGLKPDIITATSVGSINGIKLAEAGPQVSTHAQVVEELLALWRAQMGPQDMWAYQPFVEARPLLKALVEGLFMHTVNPQIVGSPPPPHLPVPSVPVWTVQAILGVLAGLATAARDVAEFVFSDQQSLLNLDPIKEALQKYVTPDKVAKSGTHLRMAAVSLESGTVRYVTETGDLLERDLTRIDLGSTTTTAPGQAPDCSSESTTFDDAKRDWEQATLDVQNAATPAEKAAAARIAKEKLAVMEAARHAYDVCRAQPVPTTTTTTQIKLALFDGAIASASIPFAFPPVELHGEHYVDGGVRELLPLHAAARMDADKIYAVACSALKRPYSEGAFAGAGALRIAGRSFGLIYDELAWDEEVLDAELVRAGQVRTPSVLTGAALNPANSVLDWNAPYPLPTPITHQSEVVLIEPWTDFYDITEIVPELIELELAYGWMRAHEVVHGVPIDQCSSDSIARSLYALYAYRTLIPGTPQSRIDDVHDALLAEASARKTALGSDSLPPEAGNW